MKRQRKLGFFTQGSGHLVKARCKSPRVTYSLFRNAPLCRWTPWQTPFITRGATKRLSLLRCWPRRWKRWALGARVPELDSNGKWYQRLSLGEQQRVAFARILLSKPAVVFLDGATSALDEAGEKDLYNLVAFCPLAANGGECRAPKHPNRLARPGIRLSKLSPRS